MSIYQVFFSLENSYKKISTTLKYGGRKLYFHGKNSTLQRYIKIIYRLNFKAKNINLPLIPVVPKVDMERCFSWICFSQDAFNFNDRIECPNYIFGTINKLFFLDSN